MVIVRARLGTLPQSVSVVDIADGVSIPLFARDFPTFAGALFRLTIMRVLHPQIAAGLLLMALTLSACQPPRSGAATTPPTPSANIAEPTSCMAPAPSSSTSLDDSPIAAPLVTFDTAWAIIARTHWDTTYNGVNWRGLRDELRPKAAAAKTTGELRAILSDMVGRLKQSHFSIIPREVSDVASGVGEKASDQSGTTGATFRLIDGDIVVTEAPPTSAAAKVGVRAGWRLESVRGCALAPRLARVTAGVEPRRASLMAYSIATQMLAGPVGDTVIATFRDGDGRARTVPIVRDREAGTVAKFGNLPPLTSALSFDRVQRDGKTVGIIRFNIWMPVLSPQFDAAMDSLRGSDAIIIDVRGNFGGVAGMASGVAGHFLDTATSIGTMIQRGVTMKFVANPRLIDTRNQRVAPFSGPVAVLVDELSISTSELFAGGMKALGRARIVGSQSAGQALPSVPERLPNGDILYHAIADFLAPTGKSLEGDGVAPDERVTLTRRALLDGKDPAKEAALAWLVKAAKMPRKAATP